MCEEGFEPPTLLENKFTVCRGPPSPQLTQILMVRDDGLEPPFTESKSAVLPLY